MIFLFISIPMQKICTSFLKWVRHFKIFHWKIQKGDKKLFNVFGHAEYRNRTRNQKWDMQANGKLYFTGLNAGDYHAYASLQRFVGKEWVMHR